MKASGVKYVIIERVEGPSHLCNRPDVLKTLTGAEARLFEWSHTVPAATYDKADVTFVDHDGNSFKRQIYLKNGVSQNLSDLFPE